MNQPLLSILIPTVVGREVPLSHLYCKLYSLCGADGNLIQDSVIQDHLINRTYRIQRFYFSKKNIEIVIAHDNKEATIGEKREYLYQVSNGLFSWMIDDDDDVSDDSIELILEAIKSNTEIPVITFEERCIMNGAYKSSNHSIKYESWKDNFDGFDYTRCAFYKDVIRTDIARSVPFPKIRYNEDEQWSMAIKPLLTDEIHIPKELYHYIYEPKETHEERYGLNLD